MARQKGCCALSERIRKQHRGARNSARSDVGASKKERSRPEWQLAGPAPNDASTVRDTPCHDDRARRSDALRRKIPRGRPRPQTSAGKPNCPRPARQGHSNCHPRNGSSIAHQFLMEWRVRLTSRGQCSFSNRYDCFRLRCRKLFAQIGDRSAVGVSSWGIDRMSRFPFCSRLERSLSVRENYANRSIRSCKLTKRLESGSPRWQEATTTAQPSASW
jgi:hypothetical protein